ncbi:uncharacterized protein N7496_011430 [Penicillium cataractarum]|uniref:Zn(2)-C6 fungal-type domain-containing protein n=1 Tax=Penicillium cataractarum TaxID=2100454 RepID=A0A9W9RF12_9EURO|nr:uncharacterized protein N7496_011430 [Penicillium cataractarum]KAJ5359017.1 hypothetical protein N7496_011430 [Penicillium cataractarum]
MALQSRRPQRRRVNRACNTCRKSRIRCDGIRPRCGTCHRRREECSYNDGPPGSRTIPQSKPSHGAVPAPFNSFSTNLEVSGNLGPVPIGDEDDVGVTAMGLVSKSPKGDYATGKEHFGESSAIAFIQQLQDTLRIDSTVSSPNAGQTRSQRLGHQEGPLHETGISSLPPRPLADHLVSCYFSRIHSLYPFVHEPAFRDAYQSLWEPGQPGSTKIKARGLGLGSLDVSSTTFYFALNAVFALGCQFSDVVQVDREVTSEAFFKLCKPALDLNYLENGDLALCQTLLLMAHYLQSSSTKPLLACNRNGLS